MAVSRHLGFYRTGNMVIRSADPENPGLEPNMEWIECTVCEIFASTYTVTLKLGLKAALLDRAQPTLYSSSIVTMTLSITVSET